MAFTHVFLLYIAVFMCLATDICRCCTDSQYCEEDICDCESCIKNNSRCLNCTRILHHPGCKFRSMRNNSENINQTRYRITPPTVIDGDKHTTADPSRTQLTDRGLNTNTRWYIFIWVSVFVVFLTGIGIWSSCMTWRKHKQQTREIDECFEMTTPMYPPIEQLRYIEGTACESCTQNTDSSFTWN